MVFIVQNLEKQYLDRDGFWTADIKSARTWSAPGHAKNSIRHSLPVGYSVMIVPCQLARMTPVHWLVC